MALLLVRNPWRAVLGVCLLAVFGGVADGEQLPVRSFGIEDGLAGDSITRILQDPRGYLWIGTTDGLSRFDGERFLSYGTAEGLPHTRVYDLLVTREGTYWIATRDGLARLVPDPLPDGKVFEPVGLGSAGPEPVYALYEDHAGRLWIGGEARLFVLEGGAEAIREIELGRQGLPSGRVEAFAETADGSLWVGTEGGLLRLAPGGGWTSYPVKPHHGNDSVHDLEVDRQDRLWIAHEQHAVVLWPAPADRAVDGRRAPLAQQAEKAGCLVSAGGAGRLPAIPGEVCLLGGPGEAGWRQVHIASKEGLVWMATARGLFVWHQGRLRLATEQNGLAERSLTAVLEDRDTNIWLGTESRGLQRLADNGFVGFTQEDGLAHPRITAIIPGRDGALYVQSGDTFEGALWLHRLSSSGLEAIRPKLPPEVTYLGWSMRQTAVLDQEGRWWLATGQGLLRYPAVSRFADLASTEPHRYTARDGLGGNSILRLLEDRHGDLWIGTYGERPLTRWLRATGEMRTYGRDDGLPDGLPSALAEDRAGQIWIGFADKGLVRLHAGRFERLGAGDGLPEGAIQDLFVDRSGRLWIATEDGGAGRLDVPAAPRQRLRITRVHGLSSNEVRCVAEDRWGRIYLGGRKGVDRLDPRSGRIDHFTTVDGLTSNAVDVLRRDGMGLIWAGTNGGLSRLVPIATGKAAAVPSSWITEIRVDGVPKPVSTLGASTVPELELEAGRNRLEIEFLAVSFVPGRRIQYEHKLVGIHRTWSRATMSRSVLLAHLAPGSFRFLVRAVAPEEGKESGKYAELHLVVLPPLWRRPWFLGLAVLVLAGGAAALYRYRVAHLLALERMRTRIATDLHDDLGSSLSRISILSEVARRRAEADPESGRLLTEIGETAREMMEALSESIWSIDPRRDDLRSLATRIRRFAGDLLEGRGIAWHLQAPPDGELVRLSPGERRQLYLIVKEALHNAARHSGAHAVSMDLGLSGRRLAAEIRDDGKGFMPPEESDDVGRHGLSSMKARAIALGGRLTIDSIPGQGTRIRLDVPLSGRSA